MTPGAQAFSIPVPDFTDDNMVLAFLTPAAQAVTDITDSTINTAVTAWVTNPNPTTATTTYGNIADWDVSTVSDMDSLFEDKPTVNANIGSWNVARVVDMMHRSLPAARRVLHHLLGESGCTLHRD